MNFGNNNRESGDTLKPRAALLPLLLSLFCTTPVFSDQAADSDTNQKSGTHINLNIPLPPPARQTEPAAELANNAPVEDTTEDTAHTSAWHEVTVRPGDSLSRIFSRLQIKASDSLKLAKGKDTSFLNRLHPGQQLQVKILQDSLEEIIFDPDDFERVRVLKTEDGFSAERFQREVEVRETIVSGEIRHSLFSTAKTAGLSNNLTMELADIYAWDIDFALDIRHGDSFTVLYEEYYRDGEKLGNGDIIAAEFINQGKAFRAIRYTTSDGNTSYYTPEGLSLRKPFLRTPVNFSRISSRFSLARRHPILNRIRSHKGVDYAAPTGTPIKAAGDGKITLRGRNGGYGNCITIQHGTRYQTLYGHLSRFRSGLRVGSRVTQGQIIGYVGKSGLATGPHLHYEFRVDGVHRNPLTVEFPKAEPLPRSEMADFTLHTKTLEAQLDAYAETQLASSGTIITN